MIRIYYWITRYYDDPNVDRSYGVWGDCSYEFECGYYMNNTFKPSESIWIVPNTWTDIDWV